MLSSPTVIWQWFAPGKMFTKAVVNLPVGQNVWIYLAAVNVPNKYSLVIKRKVQFNIKSNAVVLFYIFNCNTILTKQSQCYPDKT